jgi:DNA-binding NarL/FixJ family response regulator
MIAPSARALIVEDDASWQQILTEILTDAGLNVTVVDSLEAAVARLRAAPHRLAVVDLSLGRAGFQNRDGLRVLEAVRRQDPGCATVLLSGFATVELAVIALSEHGALSCLRKEAFDRTEFRQLIDQALARAPLGGDATAGQNGERRDASGQDTSAGHTPAGGLALVVEDDAGWRSILSELLCEAGYTPRLCASLGEAVGRLRREAYALAVLDLSLGGPATLRANTKPRPTPEESLSGYRLLASTRAAGIPTIVVSGVASPADIESAYSEQGIFAFVEKQTFDRCGFLQTVRDARAPEGADSALSCLTRREREVLELVAQGLTNAETAAALFITVNTVKRHLKAIFRKLGVHTRSAAAAKAVSAGVSVEWPGPGSPLAHPRPRQ